MYTILMWPLKKLALFCLQTLKQPADARDRGGLLHLGVRAILHLLPPLGQPLDLAALFSWDRPRLLLVPSCWAWYASFGLDTLSLTCWVHLFFFPAVFLCVCGCVIFLFVCSFLLVHNFKDWKHCLFLFVCSFLLVHNFKDWKHSLRC